MTDIEKQVRRLVVNECANHAREQNGIRDYCCYEWTEGYRCIYVLKDAARCGYFEKSVLPVDVALEALYRADRKAQAAGYELTKLQARVALEAAIGPASICAKCGKSFQARSTRQKHCASCRKAVLSEKRRTASRKRSA